MSRRHRWKRTGGNRSHFKAGDWNVIDDRTGFKEKASDCSLEMYTNALVKTEDVDPPHPQSYHGPAPATRPPPSIVRPDTGE